MTAGIEFEESSESASQRGTPRASEPWVKWPQSHSMTGTFMPKWNRMYSLSKNLKMILEF
jgi:hypothetical protein